MAVRTHDLTKTFRGKPAVDRLSLEVPAGSIFALVGPNGAGKTTTLKILINILQATSGTAETLGIDSRELAPAHLTQIGYVSENQDLPEWMTLDYLFSYLKPFYPGWDDALASELIQQMELPRDIAIKHMSRGTRMKAALASSLAYRPKLLILDEPFGGLDPLARDEFTESVLDRSGDTTIVISSHDLADIESFASHVAYVDMGKLFLSEELAALTGRFREVEVVTENPVNLPANRPETWLRVENAGTVVRFIETQYDRQRTDAAAREVFPGVRQVNATSMSLRAIFVALARHNRRVRGGGQ